MENQLTLCKGIILLGLMLTFGISVIYCQEYTDKRLHYTICYNLSIPGDTLILEVRNTSISRQYAERYTAIRDTLGTFSFNVEVPFSEGYIRLIKVRPTRRSDNRLLINNMFWESGDSIYINVFEHKYPSNPLITRKFSGKGSSKYQASEMIDRRTIELNQSVIKQYAFQNPLTDTLYTHKHIENEKLKILDQYKSSMSTLSFDILKTKVLMSSWTSATVGMERFVPDSNLQKLVAEKMKELFYPMKQWVENEEALANSIEYIKFYTLYFRLYSQFSRNRYLESRFIKGNVDASDLLRTIIDSSSGKIRQALIIAFLSNLGASLELNNIYHHSKLYLKDEPYISEYNALVSKTNKDISIYSFKDTDGRAIQISDFKGKFVLIDTWWTGCPGCAHYYKNVVSRLEEHFKSENNFVIISISSDMSLSGWKKSISSGIYCDPDGINLYTNGLKMNHPMYQALDIRSGPVPILIDQEGKILAFNTPELYDVGVFIEKIKRLL